MTLWDIQIPVLLPSKPCARNPRDGVVKEICSEHWFEVFAQAVPGHIKYETPWLLPPILDDEALRCVLFVESDVKTGGPGFDGQQCHEVLWQVSGERYKSMSMGDILEGLVDALEKRHWPRRKRESEDVL